MIDAPCCYVSLRGSSCLSYCYGVGCLHVLLLFDCGLCIRSSGGAFYIGVYLYCYVQLCICYIGIPVCCRVKPVFWCLVLFSTRLLYIWYSYCLIFVLLRVMSLVFAFICYWYVCMCLIALLVRVCVCVYGVA